MQRFLACVYACVFLLSIDRANRMGMCVYVCVLSRVFSAPLTLSLSRYVLQLSQGG